MVVVVTNATAMDSNAATAFCKMLAASFAYRKIDCEIISSKVERSLIDVTSSEAVNSDFAKELGSKELADFHIDVRSYDPESVGSSIASLDFIIAKVPGVTDDDTNVSITNTLGNFSDTEEKILIPHTMYPSIYSSLVLKVGTICIIVNEGSADLYRSAADELAEFVENLIY